MVSAPYPASASRSVVAVRMAACARALRRLAGPMTADRTGAPSVMAAVAPHRTPIRNDTLRLDSFQTGGVASICATRPTAPTLPFSAGIQISEADAPADMAGVIHARSL